LTVTTKRLKRYPLRQSPFFRLRTRKKLCRHLGIPLNQMKALASPDLNYRLWDVEKNGKTRHIESPTFPLKGVQSRIATLLSRIMPPDFLYCPTKGRSYLSNAAQHANSRVIHTLDIAEYFPSTPTERVKSFFRERMECSLDVAAILAALTTISGHLPTGGPASAILSYYANDLMWLKISALTKEAGCVLTVYMDDIAVSGDAVPNELLWNIRKLIRSSHLRYHKEKHFENKVSEITGVIIRDGILAVPNRHRLKAHTVRKEIQSARNRGEARPLVRRLKGLEEVDRQLRLVNDHLVEQRNLTTDVGR